MRHLSSERLLEAAAVALAVLAVVLIALAATAVIGWPGNAGA